MATEATNPTTSSGVLEEFESSPVLMLALLGQEATRRLREALDALYQLKKLSRAD